MKKAVSIASLMLAVAALSACSKSAEQNVTAENASNESDIGANEAIGELSDNAATENAANGL
ncbi:hypothetical protein HL653_10300 [Sphingomonas sp. AP4-R1]|uniref:hypothetical protein n=1 Tax=Sphingomonas sp. AP4-R1 TaxID=2735134 RepID=UPI0014933CFF|nr:hypothetical protein [Sphingomonas sp. AP4-R1]QJU58135.1 hypothetical protein HL653_10300 [Sphingomonas sp. AP4-R1]